MALVLNVLTMMLPKLLFTSRIILILVLCAVKASTIALIRTVFAADFKSIPLWFRSVLIVAVCDALFGSLLISAGCSPSSLLEAPYDIHDSSCPHNVGPFASDDNFSHFSFPVFDPLTFQTFTDIL